MLVAQQRQLTEEWPMPTNVFNGGKSLNEKSIHQRAIDRLALTLRARDGLNCLFHSDVSGAKSKYLLSRGILCHVEIERSLKIGFCRIVPDITVFDGGGNLLFVIEVWHSHAVSAQKRLRFALANIPWLEVRALSVMRRFRNQLLPVLDWGEMEINPPRQNILI